MYSWKKLANVDILIAALLLLFVYIALGKIPVGERAEGFYVIRPTHWSANPTEVNIELTSFYPSTLTCAVSSPYSSGTYVLDSRQSITFHIKGSFPPNQFVTIPLEINCGMVHESGKIVAFIFT